MNEYFKKPVAAHDTKSGQAGCRTETLPKAFYKLVKGSYELVIETADRFLSVNKANGGHVDHWS